MIKVLIFEGVDKTGKDTLIRQVHKISKYKYWTINRGIGTAIVYGKLNNRDVDLKDYTKQEYQLLALNPLVVYLTASNSEIAERIKETNEKDIKVSEITRLKMLYANYLKRTPIPYIKVDTTDKTVRQCAWEIVRAIQNLEVELKQEKKKNG